MSTSEKRDLWIEECASSVYDIGWWEVLDGDDCVANFKHAADARRFVESERTEGES